MPKYVYVECKESDIPSFVRWDVPARNQGQIVEVAYGAIGLAREADVGDPYKRVVDRSDLHVAYYKLRD